MERLTYKFNSLSLANFAANTIKKDGVGTILSNNNGFVVVETADVNSVQEIANDARGYEVLRESMTEKKKLTPDQLKKVNTSLRAKMIAKKDAKKEEVEEEEFVGEKLIGKQHKLDFNKDGKLTGKDFEILKTIRKQKAKKEEVGIEEIYDGEKSRAAMQSNIKKAPTPKDKEELVKLHNAIKKSPKVYGISMDALGDLAPDETPSRKKLTPMAARAADGYDAKNTDRSVNLGIISKINKRIKEEVGIEEAVDAKQAEIDAKIRKVNAADAVAKIKEIVNSYDKQTKRMIIAGMKSIKESVKDAYAEVTEDEIISEDEWGGGFETSREAQAGVQAAMKADAKKRQMLIISALQQVIDGKMSKAAFKKLTGHSYDEMMTLPFYSKKVKMKKEEVENLDESATKAAIEDFMYDTLTKAAIAELKPIVKSKTSDRMKKIEAVLKKHKIPTTSPIGGKSAQLVADFFDSFHGESVDEAYARPNEKPIGAFTLAGATKFSNSAQGRFEYRISEDSWGKSHGLPHEVCVSSKDPTGKQNWRAANVKGTVCIIALDEDAEGKPVLEKWAIRNHVKYVKAEETDQEGEVIKEQDRAAVQGSKSSFKKAI